MKASDASKKFLRQPKKPIVMSTASNLQVLYEDNHIIAVNKRSSDIVQGDGKGINEFKNIDSPSKRESFIDY